MCSLIRVVQYQKQKEAEKQLADDERRLRKEMNAKRAREEAEKLHEVRLLLHSLSLLRVTGRGS